MQRVLFAFFALLLVGWAPTHAAESAPAWPGTEWETSTPEAQGMDSAVLAQLVEYGRNAKMDSLLVVRNGRIVLDAYYAPFAPGMRHRVNSVTKAFVGALTGIAIARGDLPSVETPMSDVVRGDAALAQRWAGMTLQHVLEGTSGVNWKEPLDGGSAVDAIAMGRAPDWKQYVLQRPLARPPGSSFDYNSGITHLLSAVLAERTGMPTQAYAQQHLFGPIGIGGYRWRTDPQGVATGGWGLYLAPRDMARFGLLYLRGGEWNGRQVLPRAWTQRVFDARVPMTVPGFAYGDFWWAYQRLRAYLASGYLGQAILVLPDEGIVAVMTGRAGYPAVDLVRNLRRAVKAEAALPSNEEAFGRLQALVAEVAQEPAPPAAVAGMRIPAGTRFALADNRLGLQELVLDLEHASPRYRIVGRSPAGPVLLERAVGLAGRFARSTHEGAVVLNRATWTAADTLVVEHHVPEELVAFRYELRFDGDALQLTHVGADGSRLALTGRRIAP
ncbi:MAG TPA: serine hydrolase [Ramlibacter sp.]|jgi:CubicO group peptidase (beta-lactamase class C family)|nr:serine hydrolase [Ramlibacter sp.]